MTCIVPDLAGGFQEEIGRLSEAVVLRLIILGIRHIKAQLSHLCCIQHVCIVCMLVSMWYESKTPNKIGASIYIHAYTQVYLP
jgi:hypothetical protein